VRWHNNSCHCVTMPLWLLCTYFQAPCLHCFPIISGTNQNMPWPCSEPTCESQEMGICLRLCTKKLKGVKSPPSNPANSSA
jgi:hypothetical protein